VLNTIVVSSGPQLAPSDPVKLPPVSQIVIGWPPLTDTFLSVVPTANPTQSPLGEKNGFHAPSVPRSGVAVASSSARRYSCPSALLEPLSARYTTRVPSGEIASGTA